MDRLSILLIACILIVSSAVATMMRRETFEIRSPLDRSCVTQLCISLRDSGDRRSVFAKSVLPTFPRTRFVLVDRDNLNPGRGCYDSHVRCMRIALEEGGKQALVFEDDATYAEDIRDDAWNEVARFLDSSIEFDVLLLGWGDGSCYREKTCAPLQEIDGYRQIKRGKRLCTHAIIYSREFMRKFIDRHDRHGFPGYELDDFLVSIPGIRMYVVEPEIFTQHDFPSTIDDPKIQRVYFKK